MLPEEVLQRRIELLEAFARSLEGEERRAVLEILERVRAEA